jgi:hypothetical protein
VLPLHEATIEPLHVAADAAAAESTAEAIADPATDESAAEPLHAAIAGAALTETSCLCV